MPNPFRNPQEIMLAATEDLGEVATEIALLEKVGTKADWDKEPSTERLQKEIQQLMNILGSLANFYQIKLDTEV